MSEGVELCIFLLIFAIISITLPLDLITLTNYLAEVGPVLPAKKMQCVMFRNQEMIMHTKGNQKGVGSK